MLSDALDVLPDVTPEKEARGRAHDADERSGELPETYAAQQAGSATLRGVLRMAPGSPTSGRKSARIQSARKRRAGRAGETLAFYAGKLDRIDLDRLDRREVAQDPILTKDSCARSLARISYHALASSAPASRIGARGSPTGARWHPRSFDEIVAMRPFAHSMSNLRG